MNRKIIQYITCEDGCDMSPIMGTTIGCCVLDAQVSALLNKGWELYGSPYGIESISPYGIESIACQAMVLYDDSTPLEAAFHIGKDNNDVK